MRKIIVQEMLTVDGFFAGPKGEIDWHVVGPEFNEYAIGVLKGVDTFMFGRVTYDLMASYWPAPEALKNDPVVAGFMNSLQKIVFSKKMKGAAGAEKNLWNNSKILHEIDRDEILKIKQRPGKDIIIFGSGTVVSTLTDLGLIDQYRLIVNPIVLGKGKSLFADVEKRHKLTLVDTKTFTSGNILLQYLPT